LPFTLSLRISGSELSVTARWNIGGLVSTLTARGRQPAVISFGEGETATWDSAVATIGGSPGPGSRCQQKGDRVALQTPLAGLDRAALAVLMARRCGGADLTI
jgi:hypothetical protein